MTEGYDGRQVVGMDLHRRRSVLVRMTEDGRKLETVRITNSPAALRAAISRAGKNPRVVIEATYGWYWAVDVLEAIQRQPASSRPRQVKDAIIARRGKQAKNIAKVAAARELLTLVFYGMRDGRIRRAAPPGQAA